MARKGSEENARVERGCELMLRLAHGGTQSSSHLSEGIIVMEDGEPLKGALHMVYFHKYEWVVLLVKCLLSGWMLEFEVEVDVH